MTNASSSSAVSGAPPAVAARIALVSPVVVALLIVVLHAIKPELEPSWRFVSEYAIGRYGWIMKLAFLVWSVGCFGLALVLLHEVRAWTGKVGVAVLFVVAIALVPAGLFAQDPVTTKPEEATTSGHIHALAAMIGVPGIAIAAMLVSASLWRTNPGWRPYRAPLMATAHATWISFVVMGLYLVWALPRTGGFNPDLWAGWMNRLVVATYLAWQVTIAYRLGTNGRTR